MSKTHTVVSGDTLFSLGKKYGLTVNELKHINGLNSNTILVGQILKVGKTVHTVVSGDTLFSLAKKYGTTVENLKSINGLKSDVIKVGQILNLSVNNQQQLILQDEYGNVFKNISYEMTLSDNSVHSGMSDDKGCISCMGIINSASDVIEIKLDMGIVNSCCGTHMMLAQTNYNKIHTSALPAFLLDEIKKEASEKNKRIVIPYKIHKINKTLQSVNSLTLSLIAIHEVLKPDIKQTRNLRNEERDLVLKIFKGKVNPDLIKVHEGKYLGKVQDDMVAMTPNGEMYFPTALYRDNFADANIKKLNEQKYLDDLYLFVHELVHVWQHQLKYDVKGHGAKIAAQSLGYLLINPYKTHRVIKKRNHFSEFNMEQQADIIAYEYMYWEKNGHEYRDDISLTKQIDRVKFVKQFEQDPSNTDLLPKSDDLLKTLFDYDVLGTV